MDGYPHVHNDPSALTGLGITIGLLAQSLPSGSVQQPFCANEKPDSFCRVKTQLVIRNTLSKGKKIMIINWDPGNVTGLILARWW